MPRRADTPGRWALRLAVALVAALYVALLLAERGERRAAEAASRERAAAMIRREHERLWRERDPLPPLYSHPIREGEH